MPSRLVLLIGSVFICQFFPSVTLGLVRQLTKWVQIDCERTRVTSKSYWTPVGNRSTESVHFSLLNWNLNLIIFGLILPKYRLLDGSFDLFGDRHVDWSSVLTSVLRPQFCAKVYPWLVAFSPYSCTFIWSCPTSLSPSLLSGLGPFVYVYV